MKVSVPLAKSYRLLNHGPVTLVSAADEQEQNVMAAAWAMALDFEPAKVAVVLDKQTHTRQLIEKTGEFVLNIPSKQLAKLTLQVGSTSGKEINKWTSFDIQKEAETDSRIPLLKDCAAWLHCRVISEPHNQQTYDLFIGEVIAAWADDLAFENGHWDFKDESLKTLHYVAGGHFFVTGEAIEVSSGLDSPD
ncbi:flavin reductase family protein [Leeia sp. TBRC 13508]|uniref:Flavin reductase family protein n=1 Tax=Leeia speluncae TaxID=2884804 RepID=A0ABS8D224_9NEIS|nr:flavin reductase family protein [Leeia speluncae]MCB6182023.1 flavin reductase family protein [Leeia speluncae]